MRKIIITSIVSAAVVAVFGVACSTTKADPTPTVVEDTPTPIGTPTFTSQQIAYSQSVATQAVQSAIYAQQTFAARPTSTPVPPPYKLALLASSCTNHSGGYAVCEGSVKNISGGRLENIEAVIEWAEAAAPGSPTESSDDALIDYNPLLPEQESPWTVYSSNHNPRLQYFHVRFKTIGGVLLLTRRDDQ